MNKSNPQASAQPPSRLHDHQTKISAPASYLAAMAILFVIGMNLRPALSSVAAVLASIRTSTGLSSTGAGLLTTLPILCFGLAAPFAPRLLRMVSVERAILFGLLALTVSIGLRNFFGIPGLFIGTVVVGASIGLVMVLLPAIIKQDFPHKVGLTMGIYTMALCAGAALAAGITAPLEKLADGSWQVALAFWALPALIAACVWWPQLRRGSHQGQPIRKKVSGLTRSALAWQVTAFMGLQSSLAYCVFGWLPTILIDRGMGPLLAGFVLSISIAMQLITSLTGPWLATRGRDQRPVLVAMVIATMIGLLGCLYAPIDNIWPWAILLGLGQGGCFSIGMALIVLRSPNSQVAASLSAMAQGIGYAAASMGPFAVGILHGTMHNWDGVAVLFMVLSVAALIAALGAGRNMYIDAKVESVG
jgi:CP family cyanate transporter-like MFS transporter